MNYSSLLFIVESVRTHTRPFNVHFFIVLFYEGFDNSKFLSVNIPLSFTSVSPFPLTNSFAELASVSRLSLACTCIASITQCDVKYK